jgi:hypothetical protein
MSENSTSVQATAETESPRPIIQLLDQPEAGGCCGGGSCGI